MMEREAPGRVIDHCTSLRHLGRDFGAFNLEVYLATDAGGTYSFTTVSSSIPTVKSTYITRYEYTLNRGAAEAERI
jgi:hypothetical protein